MSASKVGFNPSQVGYKRRQSHEEGAQSARFNPSQVGYKRFPPCFSCRAQYCFNPSQVGYKPGLSPRYVKITREMFQSLTGRLQTIYLRREKSIILKFQSLTGRLQTVVEPAMRAWLLVFQSLTGRLQTDLGDTGVLLPTTGFNPSQVGYKPKPNAPPRSLESSFNPPQVGYKPTRLLRVGPANEFKTVPICKVPALPVGGFVIPHRCR